MIIVIYGNGLASISRKVSEIKLKFNLFSTQEFSAKQVDFDQALIGLSTGNLFSEKRLIVLEDFDDKIDLDKLPSDSEITVILKFTKNLATNSILLKKAALLKAQIFNFSEAEETDIFPFLDALVERKPKFLPQFDSLLSQWGGQYLLTMIFYILRRMVQDPKHLPPFVQQKILKQKYNFPRVKIAEIYQASLETDYKIKSGLCEEKLGLTLLINKILTI